jgi:hypothetical protein
MQEGEPSTLVYEVCLILIAKGVSDDEEEKEQERLSV